jgi:transcriptional regulator GlxA family with amidase domain
MTEPLAAEQLTAMAQTMVSAQNVAQTLGHNVTITDIAAAAFVTVRAIQLAFQRHLGMTPLDYLRSVRLDHVHRDLLAADPTSTTVTAVAYHWGFPSMSRFSAYYRLAYGTAAGSTLRS